MPAWRMVSWRPRIGGSLIALCLGWPVPMAKLPLRICWPPCWASNVMCSAVRQVLTTTWACRRPCYSLGRSIRRPWWSWVPIIPASWHPWCKWRLQIMECSRGLDMSIWNFLATCRAWLKRRGCWRSCCRLVENFSCMVMEIGLSQSANAPGLTLSAWALGRPMIGRWKLRGLNRAERTFQFGLLTPCGAEIILLH